MADDVEENRRFRAGRYINQPSGYRAFIPAQLPPEPPIEISHNLYTILSKADRALGRLDGCIQTLPNPDLFAVMYVRKEAVLSSQIEGTQSSLQDVLAAEAHLMSSTTPKDVGEVINYVNAMNYGLKRLEQLPVSIRLIREIHENLMKDVRGSHPHLTPGELRRSQNWIGPTGCTLNEATFVPPPPHEVMRVLGDLEKFIHSQSDLPALIQIGLAHAQFETIHPFLDGNGRIGRLLITLLLCQREILIKPVLYLSYYFKQHRSEYYEKLQNIRDNGDWENWLHFFLTGIAEVSLQATETARRILALREKHRDLVTEKLGTSAGRGHIVLESLFKRPIISVAEVQKKVGTSYQAANGLVHKLVGLKILHEITGNKRNRKFRYAAYISILSDSPDDKHSD